MKTVEERIKWFKDAKYGMFLHFGPYSLTGRCEWTFYLDDFTVEEYAVLAKKFDPTHYNPEEWVKIAKAAGMNYMVLTTRHHDGYCLWDTMTHNFNAVKGTPKKDIVKLFVDACHKQDMRLGLYYSLVDWRYEGIWNYKKNPESAHKMVEMAHKQVEELMSNYGKIDILWYDGSTTPEGLSTEQFWRSKELNELVRLLQPDILINDRSGSMEDFGTPERKIEPSKDGRAWESCLTLDPVSWSHVPYSPNRKTAANVISDLIEVAMGGGNLLLNIGPKPDGTLLQEEVEVLLEVGKWINKNREAIMQAKISPLNDVFSPFASGGCQARWIGCEDPTTHYLATLCWTGNEFWTVKIKGEVESVRLLEDHTEIKFFQDARNRLIFVDLPEKPYDKYSTVFKVKFKEAPELVRFDNSNNGTDMNKLFV